MKTHEVEKMIGVTKQTLYFYENEGLIQVDRDENDYRNYSDDNIRKLTIIKYLREMGVSIDDIHGLFFDNLTFQDVLKLREESINQELDDKEKILERVAIIKEKNLPLFSGLIDEKVEREKRSLGYWKSTNNVSIGRPITRGLIFRQLIIYSIISIGLALSITIGLPKIVGHHIANTFIVFIISFLIIFSIIFTFLIGDLIPSGSPYVTSRFNFIEFSEAGINYYQRSGIIQNLKAIIKVCSGEDIVTFSEYDDIQKVEIVKMDRYMKPYGYPTMAPAIPVITADFIFTFKDREPFYLVSPLMLNNDSMWVALLMREKVSFIDDPDNVLGTFLDNEWKAN